MRIRRLLLVTAVLVLAGSALAVLTCPRAAPVCAPVASAASAHVTRRSVEEIARSACVAIRAGPRTSPNGLPPGVVIIPVPQQPAPKVAPPNGVDPELYEPLRDLPTDGAGVIVFPGDTVLTSARVVGDVGNEVTILSARYPEGIRGTVFNVAATGLAWVHADRVLGSSALWVAPPARTGETLLLPHIVLPGIGLRLTEGKVVATGLQAAEAAGARVLQVDTGSSFLTDGTPVFTTRGELVGIVLRRSIRFQFQSLPAPLKGRSAHGLAHTVFVIPLSDPTVQLLGSAR